MTANCSGCTLQGSNNVIDGNPMLSVLGNYGGILPTMVPLPGSPAICMGAKPTDTNDQRGYARPNGQCYDIGAVQTAYTITFTGEPANTIVNRPIETSASGPLTVKLLDHGVNGIPGAPLTMTLAGNGALAGTTSQSTGTLGVASFGDLDVNAIGTGDTLTATASTSTAAPLSVTSTSFDITVGAISAPNSSVAANPASLTAGSTTQITVTLRDADNNPIPGASVALAGTNSATVTAVSATTNAMGVATFHVADNVAEQDSLTATSGSTTIGSAQVTFTAGSPASVVVVSGTGQSAVVTTAFAAPLVVKVEDAFGNAVSGTTVTASAPGSGASASLSPPPVTGANGMTSLSATANAVAGGPYNVVVSVPGATAATFTLTNTAGTATVTLGDLAQTYSGLPEAVTVTTVPAGLSTSVTYNGSTTVPTAAGSYPVIATVTGGNYVGSKSGTLTVTKAGSTTTVSATPAAVSPVQSVTMVATVASQTSGTPTKTVTFYDNGTALGSPATLAANGTTQLVVPSLPPGTAVITAMYSGDNNFFGSTSSNSASVVVAPYDFTFTNTGTSAYTAAPGAIASYGFALSPLYGSYAGAVSFTVTGLPAGATASFTPSTVAVGAGATTVMMSVQTATAIAHNQKRSSPFGREIVLALLLLPFLGKRSVREKLKGRMLLMVLLMADLTATLTGCGSSNGFMLQSQKTYTLTVTATSGTLLHSQAVTLIVQ
jgi:hypothetical protein